MMTGRINYLPVHRIFVVLVALLSAVADAGDFELQPHCPSSLLRDFHDTLEMNAPLSRPLHNWFEVSDCCEFTGIVCNRKKQIEVIELVNMSLSGSLLPDLSGFKHLYRLVLLQNSIQGRLPAMLPPQLIHFNIERNAVSGDIPPYNSKIIKRLILSGNHLSGEIPSSFCEIEELRALHLSSNRMIHGILPSCMGLLPHLHTFRMRDTSIIGPIPSSLCPEGHGDGLCGKFDFCRDGYYHGNDDDTDTNSTTICLPCEEDNPSNAVASSRCRLIPLISTLWPSTYPSDMPSLLPSTTPSIYEPLSSAPSVPQSRHPSQIPTSMPSLSISGTPTLFPKSHSSSPSVLIGATSVSPSHFIQSPSMEPSVLPSSSNEKPVSSAQGPAHGGIHRSNESDRTFIYIPIMFLLCLGFLVALYLSRRSRNRFFAVDSHSQGDDDGCSLFNHGVQDSMESGLYGVDTMSTASVPPPPPPTPLAQILSPDDNVKAKPQIIVRPKTLAANPKVRFLLDSKFSADEDDFLWDQEGNTPPDDPRTFVWRDVDESHTPGSNRLPGPSSSLKSCGPSFRDIIHGLECSSAVDSSLYGPGPIRSLEDSLESSTSVSLNPIGDPSLLMNSASQVRSQRQTNLKIFIDPSSSNSGSESARASLNAGEDQHHSPVLSLEEDRFYNAGIGKVSWPDVDDEESDDEDVPTFLTPMDFGDGSSRLGLPVLGIQRHSAVAVGSKEQDAVEIVQYPMKKAPPPEYYMEVSEF